MQIFSFLYTRNLIRFVIIVFPFIFQISLSHATTYYVNKDHHLANDSNSGAKELPWKTIQKAANTMLPGDSCIVTQGNYAERIIITISGESENNIVYVGKNLPFTKGFQIKADYVEVNGFEVANTPEVSTWSYESRSTGSGIFIEGKYNVISNNYVHDTGAIGIYLYIFPTVGADDSPHTSFCQVIDNIIVRAGFVGIQVVGQNHLIAGNDVSHTQMKKLNLDADGMRFFGRGHIFRGNYIHDMYLSEGNANAHIDCFQTYGMAYNILFEGNLCDNPDYGMQGFMIEQVDGPVHDLTFINNIIMAQGGLININNKGNQGDMPNMKVYNNTFYRTGYWAVILRGCPNSYVFNNLFIDCGGHSREYLTHMDTYLPQVGYNCHYITDGREPAGDPYPNDLWQIDPNVIDIGQLDFHLQDTSALINAGKPLEMVEDDYDGIPRPQGANIDIGAFEWHSGTPVSPPTAFFSLRQNYPNPFNPSTTISFKLRKSSYVELKVYNSLGQKIETLESRQLIARDFDYEYVFSGRNLASGVYFYQLVAENYAEVKKMVLIR